MAKSNKKAQAQVVSAPATQVEVAAPASEVTTTPQVAKVRYATRTWSDNWVIGNVINNPKRGKSQGRFALMHNGQTVSEYCNAVVQAGLGNRALAQADLRWGTAPQRAQFTVSPPASE